MRILHVIPSVAPRYGGPSHAIRGMTRAQAALGHEVHVATTDADGPARLDVPLDAPRIEDGVVYRYFARNLPGEWKFSWPLTRWLHESAARYDIVHVHALFCYPSLAGCRAARRAGVPYVLRPLGTLGEWSLAQRWWKKAPYYRAFERPNLLGAAAVHATSAAEAQELVALGVGARAAVVPLGVDLPDALPSRERVGDDVRLLFLSRIHQKKNVELLLDATARAVAAGARLRLDIAGSGDEGYVGELHQLARELDLAERVRFLGHLAGDAKWRALAGADAFVLPSSHENFGIAVAEAMAVGVPVIVSDQVAISADVARADAGLVVPVDAEALTHALTQAARDREALGAMGERARAYALEHYSWRGTARGLDEVYARATARGAEVAA